MCLSFYCKGFELDQFARTGRFVKERREELGLSQAEIVKRLGKLDFQTSVAAYSRIENGQGAKAHWADPKFINALADVLEISPSELQFAMGLIEKLDIDISTLRVLELVSKMDARQREKAEQILRILLDEQNREKA